MMISAMLRWLFGSRQQTSRVYRAPMSDLARRMLRDSQTARQFAMAIDPYYDDKPEKRPKIQFEGKTYAVKITGGIQLKP